MTRSRKGRRPSSPASASANASSASPARSTPAHGGGAGVGRLRRAGRGARAGHLFFCPTAPAQLCAHAWGIKAPHRCCRRRRRRRPATQGATPCTRQRHAALGLGVLLARGRRQRRPESRRVLHTRRGVGEGPPRGGWSVAAQHNARGGSSVNRELGPAQPPARPTPLLACTR